MQNESNIPRTAAETFWEDIYQKASSQSGGKPGEALARIVGDLAPGRALELGCAKGDDAVWLAKQGWSVTAVDVSPTVLAYAEENAHRAGVVDSISFEQHDLSDRIPHGGFDLAYASFFYSPTPLVRAEVFRRAAASVVSGGHLLIIDHGSRTPWSWTAKDTRYPTADEAYASLDLSPDTWRPTQVEGVERLATGPNGEQATVIDTIIFLSRL